MLGTTSTIKLCDETVLLSFCGKSLKVSRQCHIRYQHEAIRGSIVSSWYQLANLDWWGAPAMGDASQGVWGIIAYTNWPPYKWTSPIPVQQCLDRYFTLCTSPVWSRVRYWTVPVQSGPVRINTQMCSDQFFYFNTLGDLIYLPPVPPPLLEGLEPAGAQ